MGEILARTQSRNAMSLEDGAEKFSVMRSERKKKKINKHLRETES